MSARLDAGVSLAHGLATAYVLSAFTAIIVTAASVAGLIYRTAIYPADDLRRAFASNDAVNLVVGLPLLLCSLWLARRGSMAGLLSWPGALIYFLYTYIA